MQETYGAELLPTCPKKGCNALVMKGVECPYCELRVVYHRHCAALLVKNNDADAPADTFKCIKCCRNVLKDDRGNSASTSGEKRRRESDSD